MSKIGVGVGEDFPVDEEHGGAGVGPQGAPRTEQEEFEAWKQRRAEHRAQRDAWRAQRDEWLGRKRAFKENMRRAVHESFGPGDYRGARHAMRFPFWAPFFVLIPILCIATFVAVIAAAFEAPFAFLALVMGLMLFAVVRQHHWRRHFHYGYGMAQGPIVTPPPQQQPPAPPPTISGN
jgi:Flp pilus assembly protein TadB